MLKTYTTTDINLAAYIMAQTGKDASLRKHAGNVYFDFDDSKAIQDLVNGYNSPGNEIMVYTTVLKSLRNRMYAVKNRSD